MSSVACVGVSVHKTKTPTARRRQHDTAAKQLRMLAGQTETEREGGREGGMREEKVLHSAILQDQP